MLLSCLQLAYALEVLLVHKADFFLCFSLSVLRLSWKWWNALVRTFFYDPREEMEENGGGHEVLDVPRLVISRGTLPSRDPAW